MSAGGAGGAVTSVKGCTILPAAARKLYAFCLAGMVWIDDVAYHFDALKIQLILGCVTPPPLPPHFPPPVPPPPPVPLIFPLVTPHNAWLITLFVTQGC